MLPFHMTHSARKLAAYAQQGAALRRHSQRRPEEWPFLWAESHLLTPAFIISNSVSSTDVNIMTQYLILKSP